MTPELAAAAAKLLTGKAGQQASSMQMAASAVRACEQLSHHLARLVGEAGIRAVFARSVVLSSAKFPWLANTIAGTTSLDASWPSLRKAMEQQDSLAISAAFVDLLSTFAGLLGRLIGAGLVARLLHEVWPEVFPHAAKESP